VRIILLAQEAAHVLLIEQDTWLKCLPNTGQIIGDLSWQKPKQCSEYSNKEFLI